LVINPRSSILDPQRSSEALHRNQATVSLVVSVLAHLTLPDLPQQPNTLYHHNEQYIHTRIAMRVFDACHN
jgi:hypothetical protein